MIKKRKVVIVGAGNVGASTAFCMINQGICDEIVLIDMNTERAKGETLDMIHSIAFMNRNMEIKLGDYTDCKDADVLVITASAPMGKENDRLVALKSSSKIVTSIVSSAIENGFNGFIVVVSNPVDIMTYVAYKVSGLPANQIIGSGTLLDSARLQCHIADCIDVDPKSIHAYVLGEHGDTSFENFDEAIIDHKPLRSYKELDEQTLVELETDVRKKGGKIIANKGATFYGVAMCLTQICKAILENNARVMPLSAPMTGEYGIHDLYLGSPAVVTANGISDVIELHLSEDEKKKMTYSATKMKEVVDGIEL